MSTSGQAPARKTEQDNGHEDTSEAIAGLIGFTSLRNPGAGFFNGPNHAKDSQDKTNDSDDLHGFAPRINRVLRKRKGLATVLRMGVIGSGRGERG